MPAGPNLILASGDGVTDVRNKLIALWPPFAAVAMLTRPSASAGITNPETDKTLPGAGEHTYGRTPRNARLTTTRGALRTAGLRGAP